LFFSRGVNVTHDKKKVRSVSYPTNVVQCWLRALMAKRLGTKIKIGKLLTRKNTGV
jgi:hypothetical protein